MTGRRTQQDRREATIAKVVDAAVDSLAERGYAATTIAEIAARAGVSVGGIFRHFPTRLDVVIAAADEVRRRQFVEFEAGLRALGGESTEKCLRLLRQACRAPMNTAWYEVLVAARTDAELRDRLAPFTARYHAQITELARTMPLAGTMPAALHETLVFTVVHLLDGEALSAIVHPQPEQDEARIAVLVALLRGEALVVPAAAAG